MVAEKNPPLLIIVGPTGVGKTTLGIEVARELDAEIVSADSRLFYRGMDIGTAKPTLKERQRVPHHLLDILNPDETYSLAQFQKRALSAIGDIHVQGRLPILIGGSGQYIRCITEGWQLPALEAQPALREALERWGREVGTDRLFKGLQKIDPEAASTVEPNNLRRIVRAFEVILTTGTRFSEQKKRKPPPFDILTVGLIRPRNVLYSRIDRRITSMVENGLVQEVTRLIQSGISPHANSFSAIGYSEISKYLRGEMTLVSAIEIMRKRTRVLVRRQSNWFKQSDPRITWFDLESIGTEEVVSAVNQWLMSKVVR